jgi:hypothetical protein
MPEGQLPLAPCPPLCPPLYVPRATAKKDWFLTATHLRDYAPWLSTGGTRHLPTYFRIWDLDRVARDVYGARGLARLRGARQKRAAAKDQTIRPAAGAKKRLVFEDDDDDDGEDSLLGKESTKGTVEKEAINKRRREEEGRMRSDIGQD